MPNVIKENSRGLQRLIGANILAIALPAIFAEGFVRSQYIVGQSGEAMVANVIANPFLFKSAFVAFLLAFILDVPVSVLFHTLTRRGMETVSMITMAFRLVYTAIVITVLLNFSNGFLLALNGPAAGLDPLLVSSMVEGAFTTYEFGFDLALIVFGCHLALLGYLLAKMRIVPVWLSAWVLVGGVAYILDCVLRFVAPEISGVIAPAIVVLALGELVLGIWMLIAPRAMPTAISAQANA